MNLASGVTERQRAIVGDVICQGSLRGPPTYWAPVAEYREELRRWMLHGLDVDVLREWVEPDARAAFDAFVSEFLARVEEIADEHVQVGIRLWRKALSRSDQATRAGRRGGMARGVQQADKAAPKRERIRRQHQEMKRKDPKRGEQVIADLLGVTRKQLRKSLGKRA